MVSSCHSCNFVIDGLRFFSLLVLKSFFFFFRKNIVAMVSDRSLRLLTRRRLLDGMVKHLCMQDGCWLLHVVIVSKCPLRQGSLNYPFLGGSNNANV